MYLTNWFIFPQAPAVVWCYMELVSCDLNIDGDNSGSRGSLGLPGQCQQLQKSLSWLMPPLSCHGDWFKGIREHGDQLSISLSPYNSWYNLPILQHLINLMPHSPLQEYKHVFPSSFFWEWRLGRCLELIIKCITSRVILLQEFTRSAFYL